MDSLEVSFAVWKTKHFHLSRLHSHHALALHEVGVDVLSFSLGVSIVNQDELDLLGEFVTLIDRHLLEESLICEEMLVISFFVDQFWSCKSSALKKLWLLIDLDVPLSPLLHLEQTVDHADDRFHLLIWSLFRLVQQRSHGSAVVSDGVWHAIHQAKLRRQTDGSPLVHDLQHWLPLLADF